MTKWRQASRLEMAAWSGRAVWVSDGTFGYARTLAQQETVEQAVRDFEQAGEQAVEVAVYEDGEWVA